MKIIIDDREFDGKFTENESITIPLKSNEDIIFFAKWQLLREGAENKTQYCKNIAFNTVTRFGEIFNTFPILDINEEFVKIKFDHLTSNWKKFL